jgi:uncharacterized membrane protein (DUF373 family)
VDVFERILTGVLLVLMAAVVLLATIELAWLLGKDVLTPPLFMLEIEELQELFGQFLLVLIGVELLYSMKVYSERREVHLEAVLMVAVIAVARKIVVMDPSKLPGEVLLGIAAMMLSLIFGYYLVRRGRREKDELDRESKG